MKDKTIAILIVLGLSMFCGFIVIASGLGTLTSPLNQIAGPIVCGERQLTIEKDSSAYIQGGQTHKVTAYCVDEQTGQKQDVSFELNRIITRLQFAAGLLSGLFIFGAAMVFFNWMARRLGIPFEDIFKPSVRRN